MARVRYFGVTQPAETFDRYRQARREWCDLRQRCKPMSEDYLAFDRLIHTLDAAAAHFTGNADFYGGVAKVCGTWSAP